MALHEKLRKLYLLEKHVRGMRARLDTAERRHKAQARKLEQLTAQASELNAQHRLAQAKAAELENESNTVEQRIAKLREQMNSVTSNKEYQALLVEVNTLKLDKSAAEEKALEQLSQAETLAAAVAEKDQAVQDQTKLVEGAVDEVKQAREEVGEELDKLVGQRDAAAADVPDEVREQFQWLADTHDGDAMAPVVEENRRRMEFSCGGCYMQIPAERVNALMVGGNTVVDCPNCGRLLFLATESMTESAS